MSHARGLHCTALDLDYREDPVTRQASEFATWTTQTFSDRDFEMAPDFAFTRDIVSAGDTSDFDAKVSQ